MVFQKILGVNDQVAYFMQICIFFYSSKLHIDQNIRLSKDCTCINGLVINVNRFHIAPYIINVANNGISIDIWSSPKICIFYANLHILQSKKYTFINVIG